MLLCEGYIREFLPLSEPSSICLSCSGNIIPTYMRKVDTKLTEFIQRHQSRLKGFVLNDVCINTIGREQKLYDNVVSVLEAYSLLQCTISNRLVCCLLKNHVRVGRDLVFDNYLEGRHILSRKALATLNDATVGYKVLTF